MRKKSIKNKGILLNSNQYTDKNKITAIALIAFLIIIISAINAFAFITVNLISPSNGTISNDNTPTFNYNFTSNETSLACNLYSNAGGTFQLNQSNTSVSNATNSSFTVTTLTDGEYIWNIYCNSTSEGNFSSANRTYTVDTTIPNVTLNVNTNTEFQNSNNITLNATVSDANNISHCYFYSDLSGSFTADTNITSVTNNSVLSYNYTNVTDGSYQYTVLCADEAGNTGGASYNTIIVDYVNTAPSITSISDISAALNTAIGFQVVASDSDYNDSLNYSINDTSLFAVNLSGYVSTAGSSTSTSKDYMITVCDNRGSCSNDTFNANISSTQASMSVATPSFSEGKRKDNASATFVIANTGNVNLTGIQITSTAGSKYDVIFANLPTGNTLTPGQSRTITVYTYLHEDLNSGERQIGEIIVNTNEYSPSPVALKVKVKNQMFFDEISFLSNDFTDRTNVQDSSANIDVEPGDNAKLVLKLENTFSDDNKFNFKMEEVIVKVDIEDINNSADVEYEFDDIKIKADSTQTLIWEFIIPYEAEEGEYDILIDVEAEDENGASHDISWSGTLDVSRENHNPEIIVTNVDKTEISCDRTVTTDFKVVNLGKSNENQMLLVVENKKLGLFERYDFELSNDPDSDEYFYSGQYRFTIPDFRPAGEYVISYILFYDLTNQDDLKTRKIKVKDCTNPTNVEQTQSTESPETTTTTDSSPKYSVPYVQVQESNNQAKVEEAKTPTPKVKNDTNTSSKILTPPENKALEEVITISKEEEKQVVTTSTVSTTKASRNSLAIEKSNFIHKLVNFFRSIVESF